VDDRADQTKLPDWWAGTSSALDTKMGLEVTELTPERTVGSMPVEGNTQPFGLWHGGASGVLAETLASIASYAHARPDGTAVGVDLNVTHHRPVRTGRVTGVATALHLGRRVTSYEVVISDGSGARVATARVTCQVLRPGRDDRTPDRPAS
jgi:1,4-dihydroxy-2-naphthoyl-CoA hydrolase